MPAAFHAVAEDGNMDYLCIVKGIQQGTNVHVTEETGRFDVEKVLEAHEQRCINMHVFAKIKKLGQRSM